MKTPEEYAMLAEQPSTYNELRDLFAACQREAIEVAAQVCDAFARESFEAADKNLEWHTGLKNQGEGGDMCADRIRALLTPAIPQPKCSRCAGAGDVGDQDDQRCPKCNGTGKAA